MDGRGIGMAAEVPGCAGEGCFHGGVLRGGGRGVMVGEGIFWRLGSFRFLSGEGF